jgi:hypothetical protein
MNVLSARDTMPQALQRLEHLITLLTKFTKRQLSIDHCPGHLLTVHEITHFAHNALEAGMRFFNVTHGTALREVAMHQAGVRMLSRDLAHTYIDRGDQCTRQVYHRLGSSSVRTHG